MVDATARQEFASRRIDAAALIRRAETVLSCVSSVEGSRRTATAPGRLDVMGGIAEYTGAVVVGCTIDRHASATVQTRDDGKFVVCGFPFGSTSPAEPMEFAADEFNITETPVAARRPEQPSAGDDSPWLRPVVAVLHELSRSRKRNDTCPGASILVDGDLPPHRDLAYSAAVAVATLSALCAAWGLRLDADECAALATRAENDRGGMPCGASAAMCVREGRPGALLPIDCQSARPLAAQSMPGGYAFVGIDSGAKHADADVKYRRARAAASMGARVIQAARADRNGHPGGWSGPLAQLTVDDYVNHLRDRIPTKIRGVDFCTRFNGTSDPLAEIEPDFVYKIRSRTEHHIYEAVRARQFVERIGFAERTGDGQAMKDAGELMYASHWSYGQRCGLGSVETDRLVTLLRQTGPDEGVLGARVSAYGAGGVVVALIESSDRGRAALTDVIHRYERATRCATRLFETATGDGPVFAVH
ncbi:MAG: hypothetical protein HOP29_16515 [Phycisphaerales bacterium]|nr:hypothetical protein [Phycisphaerales bacterium]